MSRQLNKLNIKTVENASDKGRLSDGGGLYLQITNKTAKSWLFMWKPKGSATRKEMGLGAFPNVSLADARKKAVELRSAIENDRNPIKERQAKRKQTLLQKEGQRTFESCAAEYIDAMSGEWSNAKHAYQWQQTLGPSYCGPILNKPIADIDLADILSVLKPVWTKKPETASRLRARIERVLSYAKTKGWRTGENPALWRGNLDQLLPKRKKKETVQHQPAMQYVDVPAFIVKLRQQEELSARLLEFVILTASRTGEAIGATWQEVDLDKALWTIPKERMKSRQEHTVPLTEAALAVLRPLHEVRTSEFVFTGQKAGKPLSNMAMLMLLRRMKIENVTVHGFRSSFRDWAGNETEFPREVAEACLAHEVGNAVERAYRRSRAIEKQRHLLSVWADYVTSVEKGNVVALHG